MSRVTQNVGFGVFDTVDGHSKGGKVQKSIVLETFGQSKSTWSDSDGLEWLEILKGSSFVI